MTGRVIELTPGATTCNVLVVPMEAPTTYLNSCDCLVIEDVFTKDDPSPANAVGAGATAVPAS